MEFFRPQLLPHLVLVMKKGTEFSAPCYRFIFCSI